ncbi:methyltransferase [Leptospira perolatii]|uniref:Methyltransferase n=1 Tax=Leptospira perolatii TaxID=2023191 RepID=A0A2M9ZLN5_9LEPT|nr:class I SAM-dependent methyltransferase [Leptospira perolatii]PJZ70214.1 methyltransferase [Leptospira perolatii]PJZ72901.1 methyltransferase [Leptospira perolatii]
MKVRDSGMPEFRYWESLFDIELILDKMEIDSNLSFLVEFGSGYGTFTLPVAKKIGGKILALDIDEEMIQFSSKRASEERLTNIEFLVRDFIAEGTGLPESSAEYVMLFNILHHESPEEILSESYRILKPNGKLGAIHWMYDVNTPRGPKMEIRPKPKELLDRIENAGFQISNPKLRQLKPWHYGILGIKK